MTAVSPASSQYDFPLKITERRTAEMDALVNEYIEENCPMYDKQFQKYLLFHLWDRMEDCHLKALLYVLMLDLGVIAKQT